MGTDPLSPLERFCRLLVDVALDAARPLRVVAADLLAGRRAAVASLAVLAHERAVGPDRRRERIESLAAAQVLAQPLEEVLLLVEGLDLGLENVALAAVAQGAQARRLLVREAMGLNY